MHDYGNESFRALLRRYRLAAGLTQEALAERAGLSARGIQDLERGEHRPLADTVQRLTAALGLVGAERAAFAQAGGLRRRPQERAACKHNLPLQLTSFVGRERELAEVTHALEQARLLTLTGTGGCGKTRLALQAAADVLERYPGGVWLVDLAPLADPTLVGATVAAVLAVPVQPGQSPETALVQALPRKRLLLLLDNCEHLLEACARLADLLLRACPELRILATSREALGITGEVSRRVPSLALPAPEEATAPERLSACEAVRLFMERALAVQPRFALTNQNAPAVAQLCQRLDGIPLALELAAARVSALSVEQLATRLDQRFRLLTGGSRAALPRQQTLQATVDWSYDLLDQQERRLFRRLAVFAGGWTLEAAEAVGAGEGIARDEVLELLARLVDKSLVQAEEQAAGTERYRLLETLRQYGRERLATSDEVEGVYGRHAAFYAALAAAAVPDLQGARQIEALDRLEAEHANLRRALEWLIARDDGDAAVRLATDRFWFWFFRSRLIEGREALQRALATPGAGPATRASGLMKLGVFCWNLGERPTARRYAEEALALATGAGDRLAEAWARFILGYTSADPPERRRHYAAALALCRALDDRFGVAVVTQLSAMAALGQGDGGAADGFLAESGRLWDQLGNPWGLGQHRWLLGRRALGRDELQAAQEHLAEALRLRGAIGFLWGVGNVRRDLGLVAHAQGDLATARRRIEQGLAECRELGLPSFVAAALVELAAVLADQGEGMQARRLLEEALQLASTASLAGTMAEALEALTGAEVLRGRPERALRFAGAAQAWREQTNTHYIYPFRRQRLEGWLAQARAAMGDAADAALAAGRLLTLDQATEEALRDQALNAVNGGTPPAL